MAETRTDSLRKPEVSPEKDSFGAEATLQGPETPAVLVSGGGRRAPIGTEQAGRYRLLRELARGGQGVVHVAWDEQLGREVAFKQLLAPRPPGQPLESLTSGEARFVREARITAQLDHPGIAPVHEVGRRADGSLYSAQKLVRGRTLAAALAGCKSLRERMALLQPLLGICQAVAYAHARGVIHRDLKPGNVMLGGLGEAVVLDWGLGRTSDEPAAGPAEAPVDSLLATDAGRTAQGALIGTPAYMSPEQAVGASAKVDARSDVWSLGAILYELLTGRRPFAGASSEEVLRAVATAPLPPVRELCPDAPQELAEVAQRALQRDPAQRYPSAKELAAELGAWLSGGRVVAHEYSSFELVQRFVVRNKTLSSLVLALFTFTLIGAVVLYARNREQKHQLAEGFLERSRAAAQQLRWNEAAIYGAAARLHEDTPGARWAAAQVGAIETRLVGHWGLWVEWLSDALAPDGSWFAATQGIRKVDVASGRVTPMPLPESTLSCALFSPDGGALVCGNWTQGTALVVGVVEGKVRWRSAPGARPSQFAFSPDGRTFALARADGALTIHDAATGEQRARLAGHAKGISSAAFSPDGKRLATAAGDVAVWDAATGAKLWSFEAGADAAWFLPDGRLATSGRTAAEIRAVGEAAPQWKARSWSTYRPAVPCRGNGNLVVAPGGISGDPELANDEDAVLWDLRAGRPIARFRGFAAGFSEDCRRLLVRTHWETRVWELGEAAWRGVGGPGHAVTAVTFTARGRLAWIGERNTSDCSAEGACWSWSVKHGPQALHVTDAESGRELASAEIDEVDWMGPSADGALLMEAFRDPAASSRYRVRVRSADDLRVLSTIDGFQAAFTADPRLLATVAPDGAIRLWDARTGKLERELATGALPSTPWLSPPVFSLDGRLIAVPEMTGVSLWDLATGAPAGRLRPAGKTRIIDANLSPGGRMIGLDQEGFAGLLEASAPPAPVARTDKFRRAWSGDHRRLVLVAKDQPMSWDRDRITLWDAEAGEHLLDVPQSVPGDLSLSQDGLLVAVASQSFASGEPALALLPLRPPRQGLSPQEELERTLQHPTRRLVETVIAETAAPVVAGIAPQLLPAAPVNAGFEEGDQGAAPPGWVAGRHPQSAPPVTVAERPFAGARCARIESSRAEADAHNADLSQAIDARPLRGKTVRLRAAVRAEVQGEAHAALRIAVGTRPPWKPFHQGPAAAWDDLPITSPEWRVYERRARVSEDADHVVFGAVLVGAGKAWIDEVSLEVVE